MLRGKSILLPFVFLSIAHGWIPIIRNAKMLIKSHSIFHPAHYPLNLSSKGVPDYDELDNEGEEEEVDAGSMRISEIKAELRLRDVDFSDCFDRESLAQKLRIARTRGRANPSIVDKFNRQRLDDTITGKSLDVNDETIKNVVAADGSLPGGMHPDVFKKLVSNPELMVLLQNSKMQDVMKMMMTGGQQSIEKAMRDDPEIYTLVTKLNQIMSQTL